MSYRSFVCALPPHEVFSSMFFFYVQLLSKNISVTCQTYEFLHHKCEHELSPDVNRSIHEVTYRAGAGLLSAESYSVLIEAGVHHS